MNVIEYKIKCQQPHVFFRFAIEATARIIAHQNMALAIRLQRTLSQTPITKPPLHEGNEETDFFEVSFLKEEVEHILGSLMSAEAATVSPSGETTPEASFIAGLGDAWNRYYDSLDNTE